MKGLVTSQFGCVGVAGADILVLNVIPAAVHIKSIGRLSYSNIGNGPRGDGNAKRRLGNRIVVDGLWVPYYIASGSLEMILELWVQCGMDYLGEAKALR